MDPLSLPPPVPTIRGYLKHKGRILGFWKTNYYWLIGHHLHVSKNDVFEEVHRTIEITPNTKIELVEKTNQPHFIIENEELGNYVLKSVPAEVYSWVFALRSCTQQEDGLSMNDFRIISVLGRGFYGKVMLVEKLDTGHLYALKVIRKKKLLEMGQVEAAIAERNLLYSIPPNNFIVSAKFAFQTPSKFYLGLQYAAGGELLHYLSHLINPYEDTIFYMGELAIAINHLHTNGIVYRDLKPENVLLDKSGHIKLTDFGLSKTIKNTTGTFCGTPEYVAPDIILRKRYTFDIDWWSFGILLYEVLYGLTPFFDDNHAIMFDNIINKDPIFPNNNYPLANELIIKLLQKDPLKRIRFDLIKIDPFFQSLDWDKISQKKVIPPSFHQVEEINLNGFSKIFTQEPPCDSDCAPTHDEQYKDFDGFSFALPE